MAPELCLLRGGGDLATGIAWRLTRAGWPVMVCELTQPLAVRRTVAMSTAVNDGSIEIEGMRAELSDSPDAAAALARTGVVAVAVSPELPAVGADVVIDARLAKRNIDTSIDHAALVVGVGPGFTAGVDCHAVIETNRGHHLGRALWSGQAEPNTGTPGIVDGKGSERVLRAAASGPASWKVAIGDSVAHGEILGSVGGSALHAPFSGVVRGLIAEGIELSIGTKVGDVDPRCERSTCFEISDKALAVGGGAVEAVLTWLNR